jgi:hypothetical protein
MIGPGLLAASLVAGCLGMAGVAATDPDREEGVYLEWLYDHKGGIDRLKEENPAALVAAGDHVCAWWRAGPLTDREARRAERQPWEDVALHDLPAESPVWDLTESARRSIARNAWHLCESASGRGGVGWSDLFDGGGGD